MATKVGMKNRAIRVAQQLGMSMGSAQHRLRKLILFNLLKKHAENVCVRCKEPIEKVEDLSIEHIEPWENRSAELFWDLNNVAFSHMKCNVAHAPKNGSEERRKIGPDGTAWCVPHQRFEPIENFFKNRTRWNGLAEYCKDARQRY